MFRRCRQLTQIAFLGAILLGVGASLCLAQLTINCSPTAATANSVLNWVAIWHNTNGIWPLGRPPTMPGGSATEGHMDWGGAPSLSHTTIGLVRPLVPDVPTDTDRWFPQLLMPQGFTGFQSLTSKQAWEENQSLGWVWVQPDPVPELPGESFNEDPKKNDRGRYDCGLDYFEETIDLPSVPAPPGTPDPIVEVTVAAAPNLNGELVKKVIVEQAAATPRPATDAVVVPTHSPIWLVGLWGEPNDVPIRGIIKRAGGTETNVLFPQDTKNGLAGWPAVNVIDLPDKLPSRSQFGSVKVAYYAAGTHYVLTQQHPMPMPYTVYILSPSATGLNKIKFNPEILKLDIDTNKQDPMSWTVGSLGVPRDGDVANGIPGNPLLGVYDTPNLETATIPTNYAQYYATYNDTIAGASKLAIYLTTALPAGTHDADPDGLLPYTGDKVWVRFVQRATVVGTTATLENGNIIRSIKGVYLNQGLTGRNYYSIGATYTKGTSTISLTSNPGQTTVWVDCRAQFQMTRTGSDNTIISEDAFSTMFADATDNDFAMYKILAVCLDESCTGTNYFLPYESPGYVVSGSIVHSAYAVWNLPLAKKPNVNWPSLYFKVRTYAVDKVTTDAAGITANRSNRATGGAYDAKMGLIRLNVSGNVLAAPTPDNNSAWTSGQKVYVFYSPLSRNTLTPGSPAPGTVQTPTETILGLQAFTDPGIANPEYNYSSTGVSTVQGKFVLTTANSLPLDTTSVQMDMNMLEPDNNGLGVVWVEGVPMYYVQGNPIDGAEYRVATSAGLNMSNPKQQPSVDWLENRREWNNKEIYDPRGHPMHYTPRFTSETDGSPKSYTVDAYAYYIDHGRWVVAKASTGITVHDSTPGGGGSLIDYAGRHDNKDWLTCYPDVLSASWPQGPDIDPLQVEPIEYANPTYPDDGSSSTQFVFRVRYHNKDGLPPLSWLHEASDPWWRWGGGTASGVVLYLDLNGTGDYRPHFMRLERPDLQPGDADYEKYQDLYIYRIIPHSTVGFGGKFQPFPYQELTSDTLGTYYDNTAYESLACGVYHYFLACSDDSLRFDVDMLPFENQSVNGQLEWGQELRTAPVSTTWPERNSTGLDPSLPRAVNGYDEVNRLAKRRYSDDGGVTSFDQTIYVDRPVRVPGYFEYSNLPYPWPSEYHPRITCELRMPSADTQNVRYDDKKYGFGRFFGTLDPFYRASNPLLPGTRVGGHDASRAETSGATTKTDNLFRLLWKQIDNKPPVRIKVFINNASERTGTDAAHQYTGYTMAPSANQPQPPNYRQGFWYQYTTKLPAGPHTYYFEADDGEHVVRWPVRPDYYDYHLKGDAGYLVDWWVPTESKADERGLATYVDNDYVPGPYVNNPCVLSEPTVTPGTGKTGQHFKYRVKYSDADGQRIYSAYIYIKINDRGDVRKFAMLPETPILDPQNDHSQDYKNGVYYYLDTATVNDLGLEPGVRQYYFEFTDDWGRQGDVNDTVQGETSRLPAGDGNWIDGPVISSNIPPTLSKGSVESQDGTANAGTLWTYRATYRDINNDAPALIKVYTGLLQPDGKTISWDAGHAMLEDDPSDVVYLDGKTYYYQTRLGGVDTVDPGQPMPEPKQYYYAYEAYDGIDWATYKSSAKDEERSNAAGCMIMQDLVSAGDSTHYGFVPLLAQRATVVTPASGAIVDIKPDSPDDIVKVSGIYLTENLSADSTSAQTYYDPTLDTNVFKFGDTVIHVASGLASGSTVNIKYVATTSVAGVPGAVPPPQTGTVSGTTVTPSDLNIQRVISVTTVGDPSTNYYRPFSTIHLNVGTGLPAGTQTAWIQYEGQAPLVGPLPIDLPPPAGVIPDAMIWENYSIFPYQILIDDQKNGWVSPNDATDKATMLMTARCVNEGQPTTQYATPDDPTSIASVEGVYTMSDFSGMNYAQTQAWKVDSSGNTISRVWRSQDPLATRVQKVYGVYTDPECNSTSTNYYNNPAPNVDNLNPPQAGWVNGFRVGRLTGPASSYSATVSNPLTGATFAQEVESIVGIYDSPPASYAVIPAESSNYYAFDHTSFQVGTRQLMVKPTAPSQIRKVLGVYTYPDLSGANYYDPTANGGAGYQTGDTYIQLSTTFSPGNLDPTQPDPTLKTPYVYVQYIDINSVVEVSPSAPLSGDTDLRWPVVAPIALVAERNPIKQITGIYDNPSLTGVNYYTPAKATTIYKYGDASAVLTGDMAPCTVIGGTAYTSAYIQYENMGFGFGPNADKIAFKRQWLGASNYMYLAYFTGGLPSYNATTNTSTLTLSQPLTAGAKVYVKMAGDTFNCGDSNIRLLDDLYSTDSAGEVIAPLVVNPTESTVIGGVIGVYLSQADAESGDLLSNSKNLYAGTEAPFTVGDTVIHLKTGLASPPALNTKNLYIVYVPKKVYVKYSDIRYTHQLRGASEQGSGYYYFPGTTHFTPDGWDATILDRNAVPHLNVFVKSDLGGQASKTDSLSDYVSSGVVGVWNNANRDGVNFFDPKKSNRFSRDPLHLKLTTQTPLGTNYLWGRCYQRGEYNIDRWNRQATFLTPRTGRVQASYFFGSKMPMAIGANTPPSLLMGSGKVAPLYGSRVTQFVFTVTYQDLDGPNGQAPAYVRVYVDGTPYDMTPVTKGTPPYREGAGYTCTLPQGLSGGSHKYHFEASDGAAVAWYDANGPHQSLLGSIAESVVDINGPWVNDPPQLLNGSANPNPATGGINPWDSVDYFITYSDADNEEPYFYDPVRDSSLSDSNKNGILDVIEYSGSPRVWIDSGVFDQTFTGTVLALEGDPMDAGKQRTIVAAGTPGWTSDQFAGKLMQVINGSLTGRVYLIQSNTKNKLVIATNDLAVDGIVVGGGDNATKFVVNGLLMSKADPSQQDFTKGVIYKITVPKLSLGNHKFHFTARSREIKPQWLLSQLSVDEQVPFSVMVRFPQGTDAIGPNVISTPPPGNSAPVITNSLVTSLYVGPRDQMASVLSASQVVQLDASLWSVIREVRGVFVNANDFDLTALTTTAESASNYYDPKTASPVFRPGDTKIVLTKPLPAAPLANLVVFGAVTGDALSQVVPDKAGAIGTVTGVYLMSDPSLAGTNYFGTFDGSKITLKQALPAGTKRVYVAFQLGAGKGWSDVPVYVKYFSEQTATSFKASDLVTFRINYRDADGDPPNYHDNVQGYVKVVFDDVNLSYQMQPVNPPAVGEVIDYKSDVAFTSQPVTLPEGTHKYHFEASDGYYGPQNAPSCRWPQGVLGDDTANDYSVKVNYKPVIVSGQVDPPTGQPATKFSFKARYMDLDGNPAKPPRVTMRISRVDGQGSDLFKELSSSGTNYISGVDFTLDLVPKDHVPPLQSGIYKVLFEATDSDGEDAIPYPGTGQPAVTFTVREPGTNHAPVIVSASVQNKATLKPSGKINDYFNYKARYSDADGDAPIADDGRTRDVLTCTVDKGTSNEIKLLLYKAVTAPASPTPQNYIDGVDYELRDPISGKRLGGGQHTFTITASDGISAAVPFEGQGPLLLIPYFDNFRLVSAKEADPSTALAMTNAVVGDEVLIVGNLSFPKNSDPDTTAPTAVDGIVIHVLKPDGTQLTLEASALPKNWTGPLIVYYGKAQQVDPAFATGVSMTLTASGDWVVSASWAGNTIWDKASTEGHDAKVSVGGPMRTVAVADPTQPEASPPLVDMITPPRIIGSPDPGGIFGYERALDMRVIRWDAASGAYFKYGTQGQFPDLKPGDAVWIKPKATYPTDPITQAEVETTGLLALGNPGKPDYTKNHRLINAFVKDYTRNATTNKLNACEIQLRTGWNQFGNIFVNWEKNPSGAVKLPRNDLGIPFSEVNVKYLNETKSLAAAAAAGWIRDYAWGYDAVGHRYVQVSASALGAERILLSWHGYWIRAFVDCVLIIDPNTSYNGLLALPLRDTRSRAEQEQQLDTPPPIPE